MPKLYRKIQNCLTAREYIHVALLRLVATFCTIQQISGRASLVNTHKPNAVFSAILGTMEAKDQIEAILFYRAEPVRKKEIISLVDIDLHEFEKAVQELIQHLKDTIYELIETESELQLVLKKNFDDLINQLKKSDLKRDIGNAGAETLAIIAYNHPISRAEIDKIRGVNSSYILRSLQVRGLIKKETSGGKDTFLLTAQLLQHLGITHKSELPGYVETMNAIEQFEETHANE